MCGAVIQLAFWGIREQGFERTELRVATENVLSERVADAPRLIREGVPRNADSSTVVASASSTSHSSQATCEDRPTDPRLRVVRGLARASSASVRRVRGRVLHCPGGLSGGSSAGRRTDGC
jgi:hypothetical protein